MTALVGRVRAGFRGALPVLALALLVTACGGEYPQSSISPRTDFADIIQGIYTSIFWWTVLIGALVWVLMGYILVRFRERPGQERPEQTHGNLALEIGWTIGPALIVVAIAIPTIQAVFATQEDPPAGADVLEVDVIGHRFWWEYQYPESGVVTANELHLPVDRPVRLRLQSQDVIHSFWVPMLGGKRDVNPVVQTPEGVDPHYTYLQFTPYETGTYMGQCAEFCGQSHSLMGTRVVVQSQEEFAAWQDRMLNPEYSSAQLPAQAAQQEEPTGDTDAAAGDGGGPEAGEAAMTAEDELVARGRQVFLEESYCVLCHAVAGTPASGALGPNLTNMGNRGTIAAGMLENTPENLVRWIRDPGALKPGVNMPGAQTPAPREGGGEWQPTNLDEEQLEAVAAYLISLDGRGGAE